VSGAGAVAAAQVRAHLSTRPAGDLPLTYRDLAVAVGLSPPGQIQAVTAALERTMMDDAAADRPFIAALVVGRATNGLPGTGFFELAARLGRLPADPDRQAAAFRAEQRAAIAFHLA